MFPASAVSGPNIDQVANNFVDDFVLTQLSYTGVLEATRIRQEGYSWRPLFPDFVRRYKLLAFPISKLDMGKETESNAIKIIQVTSKRANREGMCRKSPHIWRVVTPLPLACIASMWSVQLEGWQDKAVP